MASTSRQSSLFGVQDWQKLYAAYSQADLQSYDYESLRKNFIDYLSANYPETFNDYTESSEFVALLDVIAYMGQALAFRGDLNARENFLDTAQRRDSVIKLANLVSYNPKRNTAAQGLVKVIAISTTEDITDINGNNLSGATILWNDPANSSWQEQFNTVVNAALINNQRIGKPGNSQNLLEVKTDEYTINLPVGQTPIVPFQADINGTTMNFELVSVTSINQNYLYELPPAPASQLNMLYRNDRLGYGSPNTGFFFYFKQGTLQAVNFNFTEKIQNNLQQINIQGINNDDTWLYQLDSTGAVSTLWNQVQNVYVTTKSSSGSSVKPIFSVTSRANDEVTYVFSDGVFGEIPVGPFRAYVRSSNALQYTINPADMTGLSTSISYVSRRGRSETLTVTFALQSPNSTAQNRESLASIKERAPSRYYSQNRMVNGEDYTSFPFTLYNSIIKSKALNRTSIGVSRNLDLLDPTAKYSSTNVFSDDGALTFDNTPYTTSFSTATSYYATEFLSTTLPAILSDNGAIQYYQTYYARQNNTGTMRWNLTSINGSQVTGYFYTGTTAKNPVPVGSFSSTTAKYITPGALIKFIAPSTYYFDANNKLTQTNTGKTSIWVGVDAVDNDGYNYGVGNLSSGIGPITLNAYVPNDVQIAATACIIPEFSNTPEATVLAEALAKIRLQQDFALQFDNTKLISETRWSVIDGASIPSTNDGYLVKFTHNSTDSSYTVAVRNVNYNFSSVSDVRFTYDSSKRIYDPKTGRVLNDFVAILKQGTIPTDTRLNVVGQPVRSDGYSDDFQVLVSPINQTTNYSINPDFFTDIVPPPPTAPTTPTVTTSTAVFFKRAVQESNGQTTTTLLTPGAVVYITALPSLSAVNDHLYEYGAGTVFYCESALQNVALSPLPVVGTTYFTVTATSSIEHKLTTSSTVTLTGTSTAPGTVPFYGTFNVLSVPTSKTFTFQVSSTLQLDTSATANVINRFYESSEKPGEYPTVIELTDVTDDYLVYPGRGSLNYQYRHNSGQSTRIDPSTTNIIDLYLVTQSYYTNYMNWLADTTGTVSKPDMPTLNELQQSYSELDSYKMVSDSVVLNSVVFKPLFGTKAAPALQASIKVIKSPNTTASDTQIRSSVLSAMNTYFAIDNWNFGDTFYFSELSAYLHSKLGSLISSVILVSNDPAQKFGDMYEVRSAPYEIFVNGATISDIVVLSSLTASNMNR